jgi:hypothetical protein
MLARLFSFVSKIIVSGNLDAQQIRPKNHILVGIHWAGKAIKLTFIK